MREEEQVLLDPLILHLQSSDSGSSSAPKKKGPGLLSRIGAKLKRGIGKAARAVSRGARNVARKMDEAVYGGTT